MHIPSRSLHAPVCSMQCIQSLVKCISFHLPVFWEDLSELRKQELLNSLIGFCYQIDRWSLQHYVFLLLESIFDHLSTKSAFISYAASKNNPQPFWGGGQILSHLPAFLDNDGRYRSLTVSTLSSIYLASFMKVSEGTSIWHLPSKCQKEEYLRNDWENDVLVMSCQAILKISRWNPVGIPI